MKDVMFANLVISGVALLRNVDEIYITLFWNYSLQTFSFFGRCGEADTSNIQSLKGILNIIYTACFSNS